MPAVPLAAKSPRPVAPADPAAPLPVGKVAGIARRPEAG